MEEILRRTWAQINLDAIDNNITLIKSLLRPGVKLCAAVKADCYGHGYEHTVNEMSNAGADWFAVSNIAEALQLRKIGIEKPVLILGFTPPEKAELLAFNDISQAVFSLDYAKQLSFYAEKAGVTVNIHIKVDTGMSRIGFLYHDSVDDYCVLNDIEKACSLSGLHPEGIFTHFSSADNADGELFTRLQYDLFCSAVGRLSERGIEFELRHCSNSAAILLYPEMNFDMVRAGIILYGLYPSDCVQRKINLCPLMELKTVVSMTKKIPAGTPVSYSRTFSSEKDMIIATVPIGYADGYPRCASNKTYMLINGRKAPVIGNVCMDQLMLDVSGIPDVSAGTEVTVFGSDNGKELSVDEIARAASTINYEIVCGISRRVPRVYIRNNEIEKITDYML